MALILRRRVQHLSRGRRNLNSQPRVANARLISGMGGGAFVCGIAGYVSVAARDGPRVRVDLRGGVGILQSCS
jgi:hypothetical protein